MLSYEPVPPAVSDAMAAQEEYALDERDNAARDRAHLPGLEPTGSLRGRKPLIVRQPVDAEGKTAMPSTSPSTDHAAPRTRARAARLAQHTGTPAELPQTFRQREMALPTVSLTAPPLDLPALDPVTIVAAQPAAQACLPPDRDGIVHCPILLAGWLTTYEGGAPADNTGRNGAAALLLGILIAAGLLDLLRRVLR